MTGDTNIAGMINSGDVCCQQGTACFTKLLDFRIMEQKAGGSQVNMGELLQELKAAYGEKAEFRDGQEEAIQGVLDGKRMLIVQKTGWGKSLVYFLATKLIRKRKRGITLIVSPLLALMNNQIAAAYKLGLHVETINSENADDWECGKCSNCLDELLIPANIQYDTLIKAQSFIRQDFNEIQPRKQWPSGVFVDGRTKIKPEFWCERGRVLSNYGNSGWGELIIQGKYRDNYFDDQLVEAAAELLADFVEEHSIKWVTWIPSVRRPDLVPGFARRLAKRLDLQYAEAIEKVQDSICQKELNTSFRQHQNAEVSFEVKQAFGENVLLVDDMVDSKWTFTVCGYKLRKHGSGKVFPFALANSAGRTGDE